MKIVELRAENVKKLRAVRVTPEGSMVVVGGDNGAGKSSLLDSIVYALGGKSELPAKPVRAGEESAEIVVVIDSEPQTIVKRRIDADGKSTLEITQQTADGATLKVSKPQAFLASLVGSVAFDPLAFTKLRRDDQREMLRALIGLDLSELERQSAAKYDERTNVNRDVKRLESLVAASKHHDDAPESEISMAVLMAELDAIRDNNRVIDAQERLVGELEVFTQAKERNVVSADRSVEMAKRALADAETTLAAANGECVDARDQIEHEREALASMVRKDDAETKARIRTAATQNEKLAANRHRCDLQSQCKAARDQSDDLTKQIDTLRDEMADRLHKAAWPVDGLGFENDAVVYNGLPFDQCSSAEQLRISTAIGFAQHPKLKIALIHDGSLLDAANLEAIAKLTEENNAQLWIERVSVGAECSLIIEDGSVVCPKPTPSDKNSDDSKLFT